MMYYPGANGLANPRDFKTPVACYEDVDIKDFEIISKYQGVFFVARQVSKMLKYFCINYGDLRCFFNLKPT